MPVNVIPLPTSLRLIPARLRPTHPPLFDGEWPPSIEDAQLALALIAALDAESRGEWYEATRARLGAFLADA